MILSENGVDSLNPVSFGRTNECGQLLLELRSRNRWPLIFVQGPSGVGKRGLVELSLVSRLSRLQRGNQLPLLVPVRLTSRDTPSTIAKSCIRAVLENHPSFRSQSSYAKLGNRLANLAESDPVGVGRRLSALLKGLEQGTAGLSAIKIVVLVDGLENLFEDRKRCKREVNRSVDSGHQRDSLGFLKEMIGTRSVLFALTYRSWVHDIICGIVANSQLDPSDALFCSVPYPDKRTINSVVAARVNERTLPSASKPKIRKLARVLREDFEEAPQCLGLLPRLMDRLHDEAEALGKPVCALDYTGTEGLAGFVCGLAEEVYQMKDVSRQAIWEELFRGAMKSGEYVLQASEIAKDNELWAMALELTDWRLFSLEGNSLEEAVFLPIHDALYHKWERASSWMRDEKPSLAIVRQFDEHAISWEISNRAPAGLLYEEELLENASKVLKDKDVRRLLSPLTSDYLSASLRRVRREKAIRRLMTGSGIAAVLAAFSGVAGYAWYNQSDSGVGIAMVTAPLDEDPISEKPESPEKNATPLKEPAIEIPVDTSPGTDERAVSPVPEGNGDLAEVSPKSSPVGVLLSDAEIEEAVYGFQEFSVPEPTVSALGEAGEEKESVTKFYGPTGLTDGPALDESLNESTLLEEPGIVDAVVAVSDPEVIEEQVRRELEDTVASSFEDELPPVGKHYSVDPVAIKIEVPEVLSGESNSGDLSKVASNDGLETAQAAAMESAPLEEKVRDLPEASKKLIPVESPEGEDDPEVTETTAQVPMANPRSVDPIVAKVADEPERVPALPMEPDKKTSPDAEVAAPKKPQLPEGIHEDSNSEEVLAKFKEQSEVGNHEAAIDLLVFLHDQIVETQAQDGKRFSIGGKGLAMSLGKIAMKQGDQKAIEKSWKLGFSGGASQGGGTLSPDLRLLMARIARNAGRREDASHLLSNQKTIKPLSQEELLIGDAVIEWHFGEAEEARRSLGEISPESLNNSVIEGVFIPQELAEKEIVGKGKEESGNE